MVVGTAGTAEQMRFLLLVLMALGGVACGDGAGFGGEDIGFLEPGDQLSFDDAATAPEATSDPGSGGGTDGDGFDATCDDSGEVGTSALSLTAGSELIDVLHTDVSGDCCAVWEVDGSVVDGNNIEMTYTNVAEMECDCYCAWSFEYTLEPLEPGDWTVSAMGDQATATVE